MADLKVRVIDSVGLHARPAAVFVMTASKYKDHEVKMVINDNKILDAKSILNVMSSAINHNDEFVLRVTGDNENQVLDEIMNTLNSQKILETV